MGDMDILADAAWGVTAWWVVNVLTLILALGAGYGQASVLSLAKAPAAASCYRSFDAGVYRAGEEKLDRNVKSAWVRTQWYSLAEGVSAVRRFYGVSWNPIKLP